MATADSSSVSVDLIAPTLLTVTIASDNADDETKANAGDTITVHITSSEPHDPPEVLIAGQAATVAADESGTQFS